MGNAIYNDTKRGYATGRLLYSPPISSQTIWFMKEPAVQYWLNLMMTLEILQGMDYHISTKKVLAENIDTD
jgi:hypothetical protein